MSPRRADPASPYRVMPHRANGYLYAATCETVTGEDGRRRRRYTHWGALEDGDRFVPNLRFLTLDPAERHRLTFPAGWDLAELEGLAEEAAVGSELADPDSFENKLYGDVWLLLRVAELRGVTKDLATVFFHQAEVVNDVLTLAIYPYLTGRSLSRLPRWQRSVKVPAAHELTPSRVTRLTQSITHDQVMEFFRLRIARQPGGAFYACDSTTRTAWGTHVAEIRYGRNKDNRDRDCTLEVVVYSLTAHEPVYYRTFPGNMPDARTVRTIVKDLSELGVEDLFIIYDRGYESADNIGAFLAAGLPFLVCAKVAQEPVASRLREVEWDADGLPKGMDYDAGEGIYHAQLPLDGRAYADPDGRVTVAADGELVCDAYLDMRERVTRLAELRAAVAEERAALDARADADLVAARTRVNKGLRYHRVRFGRGEDGGWRVAAREEAADKVERAKAACGFFSAVAYRVPGDALDHLRVYRTRDEQEKYFEQMKDQMGLRTQDCSTDSGKAGRSFCAFVGLILSSVVRATWRASAELRQEFASSLDVLDEMHDVRWCGYPDGTSHMTSFLASQVRVCEAFGVEVPRECLSTSERRKADARERRSTKSLARGTRPARNRVT